VPCRKKEQGLARKRQRYEELFHVENRSAEENLEMAECSLELIEAKIFHQRQTERVQALLNAAAKKSESGIEDRCRELKERLKKT
jgi:hypothetical protein